jgi:hypothetical protein
MGLAVIIGIVGLQILDDSGRTSSSATSTTSASVSTVTTRPGPSTTVAVRPSSQVRVKVYNASGVQGRAQTLTDQLRAKGYNMQVPANLSTPRQGTVAECRRGFEREGAALGSALQVKDAAWPSSPPSGANDADCIVVIGTT